MSRRLFSLLVAAALVAAVVIGALLAARGNTSESGASEEPPPAQGPYRGSEPPPGIRLPYFALRDLTSGRLVRTADLDGQVVLVTFLDTDCGRQCPIIAGQIGRRSGGSATRSELASHSRSA